MTRSYSTFMLWLCAVILSSVMMFHTNDHVRVLEQKLRGLNAQIMAEQESLHVLNAEWVYLANPARIASAAHDHLGLQATDTKRVTALRDIATLLPVHDGIEPGQPAAIAEAPPVTAERPQQQEATVSPVAKSGRVIADRAGGHINDHMIMQHSATVASTDKIGALIGSLGLHQ